MGKFQVVGAMTHLGRKYQYRLVLVTAPRDHAVLRQVTQQVSQVFELLVGGGLSRRRPIGTLGISHRVHFIHQQTKQSFRAPARTVQEKQGVQVDGVQYPLHEIGTLERCVRHCRGFLGNHRAPDAQVTVTLAKYRAGAHLVADRELGIERTDFQEHGLIPIAQPHQVQQHLLVVRLSQYHVVVGA